jgi:hypothetical protein
MYICLSNVCNTTTQLSAGAPSIRSLLSLCPCYPAALTDGKTVTVSPFSAAVCCYTPFVPFGAITLVGSIT